MLLLLLGGAVDLTDAKAVARWNDLRAAWWEKGLRVVALVATDPGELPATVELSVAVGTASAYGSGSGARALLVAADGKVAWAGEPKAVSDELVAQLLRKAKALALGLDGEAARAPAAVAFRKGKLGEARTLAPDGPVAARVQVLLAYWQRQARRAEGAGAFDEAVTCLKRITKHLPGTEEAAAAALELKRLKAQRDVAKECSAADAYARLRQELARTKGKAKKLEALARKAERAAKRTPRTRSVERAERLAESLRADPATAALEAFIAREKIKHSGSRWRNQLPRPPQVSFAPGKTYLWHLQTNQGSVTLRFFPDVAPMHVSNAIYLTLLGFYDGLTFHRVIPGFMAQGGCPDGTGSGRIGYLFGGEFDAATKHDRAGVLSAANAGPDTDGSQFFITFGPATHLDGKHTVYGEVLRGEKTLKKIEKLGSADGPTKSRIVIEQATVTVE